LGNRQRVVGQLKISHSMMPRPFELLPLFRERVWGRRSLAPFFPNRPGNVSIGEVWFTFSENLTSQGKNLSAVLKDNPGLLGSGADPEHPDICPILVKLLFTTERLSVQVHPDDAYAKANHGSLGKTEAWYVLDAEENGEVAIGFREPLEPARLPQAALSGEIVDLLDWRKVSKGDTIFTPAGTVHAIGAGVTICEIQENSDITYRLYDYGRPRELHLDHGVKVSKLGPHTDNPEVVHLAAGRDQLVSCPYFRIERIRPTQSFGVEPDLPTYLLAICVAGSGTLDGNAVTAGQAWFIPAGGPGVQVTAPGSEWILSYSAEMPIAGLAVS
jgi:mannose-6-phosphate isomerase